MSKMFIGYLAGIVMMMFVYVIVSVVEPMWIAYVIIGLLGGLAGGLISKLGKE